MKALAATLRHARFVVAENPVTGVAFALFIFFVIAALFGPTLAPHDPLASNTAQALQPPSGKYWFGSDQIGRDIFSRALVATRLDVGIAAASGNTIPNIVLATAIINFPLDVRVARAETMMRRDAGFVDAARIAGHREIRLLIGQVMPNILPIMVVQMLLTMGYAILNAAGLSFIGLGMRPPIPEWGILVAEAASFIVSGKWWVALFPGATLMVAVFCFNLLGDGLRDIVDPRRRT